MRMTIIQLQELGYTKLYEKARRYHTDYATSHNLLNNPSFMTENENLRNRFPFEHPYTDEGRMFWRAVELGQIEQAYALFPDLREDDKGYKVTTGKLLMT